MKNTERFSNRVENYIRYRPHYPSAIIPFLKEKIGLNSHWTIADIGSGTGISAELFLNNGNKVFAVEPNERMRLAAEKYLESDKNFISVEGTAEATLLNEKSIDFIIVGQAFHWFDRDKAKKEFLRICKSQAYLLLLWNHRELNSDFLRAYEQLLQDFSIDYEQVKQRNVENIDRKSIKDIFSPGSYASHSFSHSQFFDLEGLKGRLLSSSYAPLENHPNYSPMMQRLECIFNEFNKDSWVEFKYSCNLYYGPIF